MLAVAFQEVINLSSFHPLNYFLFTDSMNCTKWWQQIGWVCCLSVTTYLLQHGSKNDLLCPGFWALTTPPDVRLRLSVERRGQVTDTLQHLPWIKRPLSERPLDSDLWPDIPQETGVQAGLSPTACTLRAGSKLCCVCVGKCVPLCIDSK